MFAGKNPGESVKKIRLGDEGVRFREAVDKFEDILFLLRRSISTRTSSSISGAARRNSLYIKGMQQVEKQELTH